MEFIMMAISGLHPDIKLFCGAAGAVNADLCSLTETRLPSPYFRPRRAAFNALPLPFRAFLKSSTTWLSSPSTQPQPIPPIQNIYKTHTAG
jgi:hypothetical protein